MFYGVFCKNMDENEHIIDGIRARESFIIGIGVLFQSEYRYAAI